MFKWVGGKKKIVGRIKERCPKDFTVYHELFCGAASLFFELKPKIAVLNDLNADLIFAFKAVKDHFGELCHAIDYLTYKYGTDKEAFEVIKTWKPEEVVLQAARFFFLTAYSYNGLYRVNTSGGFNAPRGDRVSYIDLGPLAVAKDFMRKRSVSLLCVDFEEMLPLFKGGEFIYLDPPWYKMYDQYTPERFSEEDQNRLKVFCDTVSEMGVKFLHTNANDPFIQKLYKKYNQEVISYLHSVSCGERGDKEMLIITNY